MNAKNRKKRTFDGENVYKMHTLTHRNSLKCAFFMIYYLLNFLPGSHVIFIDLGRFSAMTDISNGDQMRHRM